MNNNTLKIAFRFLTLIPLQILIGNQIKLFGFLNPQIYLLFILWYPLSDNKIGILINSFLLGLSIDILSNSGGMNTFASVFCAYIYTRVLQFTLRDNDIDYNLFSISNLKRPQLITIVFIISFIHQFILNFLDYFSINSIFRVTYASFVNSVFTTIVLIMLINIFPSAKK